MKSYLSLIPISAKIRKKQNHLTIMCIAISVFLVTAIFSMAEIGLRMEIDRLKLKHTGFRTDLNPHSDNIIYSNTCSWCFNDFWKY